MEEICYLLNELRIFCSEFYVFVFRGFELYAFDCSNIKLNITDGEAQYNNNPKHIYIISHIY